MSFWQFLVVVPLLSHLAYPVFSVGHMCIHDHDLCTFSSHGPHKSAHHTCNFTFMSHRSQLVCVVENPGKWCPLFRSTDPMVWAPMDSFGLDLCTVTWRGLNTTRPECSMEFSKQRLGKATQRTSCVTKASRSGTRCTPPAWPDAADKFV